MSGSSHAFGSDLAKVDAYRDTAADCDEIPEGSGEEFAGATVNKGGVPVRGRPALGDRAKEQVTLRLDPHVISHFRDTGDGWQSRIHRFLGTNETVLRMIHDQEGLIEDVETMIGSFEQGRSVSSSRQETRPSSGCAEHPQRQRNGPRLEGADRFRIAPIEPAQKPRATISQSGAAAIL